MNADEYKSLIRAKDVLDHTTLKETLDELVSKQEFELAGAIKRILENNQIDKPVLHSKPQELSTAYYKVDLAAIDTEKIIGILFELEAAHVGEDGETTPAASLYASLVDKWNRVVD